MAPKPILFIVVVLAALTGCSGAVSGQITPLPPATNTPTPADARPFAAVTATPTPTSLAPATPTPLSVNMEQGAARAIALATDTAMRPTPRTPITFTEGPVPITFAEFYSGYSIRTGLQLSDKLVSLDGKQVIIEGYMAPPLKPELDYFVLTRIRLSFCPFCSTAADWPDDIALVYMPPDNPVMATNAPVRLTGQLEVGASIDYETGMVSLVRVYVSRMDVLD